MHGAFVAVVSTGRSVSLVNPIDLGQTARDPKDQHFLACESLPWWYFTIN
jgi:hypothetical protein